MSQAGRISASMIVGGERRDSSDERRFEIVNPADGNVVADVPEAAEPDVDAAVSAAEHAFRGEWHRMMPRDRASVLFGLARLIRENSEELARLETRNVGKPIRDSRDEVALAANCYEYYAGAVTKAGGTTIPVSANGVSMTFREPLGVCALITPWNFPIAIMSWKVAPALAMGNTVVLKPAEQTPLTALRVAQLALDAGFPPGVLNVVTGKGSVAGERLLHHPVVRKIGFTGSTEIGKHVMRVASDTLKRITLELGGKSANIVFADCDFDRAVASAASSALGNAGQDCCARSRILVERSMHDRFVEALRTTFERVKVGDPLSEETEMGPLVTRSHLDRVTSFLEAGQNEGAKLICGGGPPEGATFAKGTYLLPTIFIEARREMKIVREEIFGPVVTVTPFDSEEDAVAMANDSNYGLSGSVWTRDGARAMRVARAVETGVISVNSGSSVFLEAPFGGVKESGIGRELGLAALDHYSELKSVFFSTEG